MGELRMRRHTRWTTGALLTLAIGWTGIPGHSLAGADWDRWLGPHQDGSAEAPGLFPEESFGLEVAWKRSLGVSYSGISVASGRAVTMVADGEKDWLTAVDAETGRAVWSNTDSDRIERAAVILLGRACERAHGLRVGQRAEQRPRHRHQPHDQPLGYLREYARRKAQRQPTPDARTQQRCHTGRVNFCCAPPLRLLDRLAEYAQGLQPCPVLAADARLVRAGRRRVDRYFVRLTERQPAGQRIQPRDLALKLRKRRRVKRLTERLDGLQQHLARSAAVRRRRGRRGRRRCRRRASR